MRSSGPDELAEYFFSIGHSREKAEQLANQFVTSRENILAEMRRLYPPAEIDSVGPLSASDTGPWGCWIKVDTDERRDALLADHVLMQRLKKAGTEGGWPAIIAIESQETVDRDFEGSWFYRLR